jgi:hypothetical protein
MPLVTVDQLRERLGWDDVREETLAEYSMRLFRVVPADESLPSIDFLFDDSVSFLQQLGSGRWHCHPNEVDDAVEMARKLVRHELCILEKRNRQGEYRGSGPVPPDAILDTLGHDADHFVRRFFGSPEVREAIDFSRYYKGKHLYIELNRKAEAEKVWKSIGGPIPQW